MSQDSPRRFPRSLLDFQAMFRDEAACLEYLTATRWPDGFVCSECGSGAEPYRFSTRPAVLRCRGCKVETSVTAGTALHRTKTPLLVWFWGAYLVTSQTPGMSALQFQRQLGVKRYETAYQMLHKLRAAMVRPNRDRIGAEWPVEVDEAWVGGRTRGEGRGVHHKALVAAAVEVRDNSAENRKLKVRRRHFHAGRLRLSVIEDRSAESLEGFVGAALQPGARVLTDGWVGYDGLAKRGYQHRPVVLDGDPDAVDEHLPIVHLVFSNLKAWLLGTHHGVSSKHLQAYLNEYVFRFNRRFSPMAAFNSVLGIAADARAPSYRDLYSGAWTHPNLALPADCVSTG